MTGDDGEGYLTSREHYMQTLIRLDDQNGKLETIIPAVFDLEQEKSIMGVVYACYHQLGSLALKETDPGKKKRLWSINTAFHRVFDAVESLPDDPPETLDTYELLSLLDKAYDVAQRADSKRNAGVSLADPIRSLRERISFELFGESDEETE